MSAYKGYGGFLNEIIFMRSQVPATMNEVAGSDRHCTYRPGLAIQIELRYAAAT